MNSPRTKVKSVKTLWQACAKVYDGMFNILPYRALLLEVVDSAEIKPGMKVLDVCCGTSNLLWALQQREIVCDVTGIDFSENMLEQARAKAGKYPGQTQYHLADVNDPVEDWGVPGGYDRIIFNNGLYLMDEPAAAIRKIATLAKRGAVLALSTPRANPSAQAVVEEHLRMAEANGMGQEEALKWLTPDLEPLLECTRIVLERYNDLDHLPNRSKLDRWFDNSGWTPAEAGTTYGGQNWLVTATKD
jgi:ubiquinone/menaquinone biosynthesis C-methylase UbiE